MTSEQHCLARLYSIIWHSKMTKQLAVAIGEKFFCCAIGVCTIHEPCSFVGTAYVTYCIGCKVTVVGLHVLQLLHRACTESVLHCASIGVRLR